MRVLYPVLRAYRRLLFWIGRRFSSYYDDNRLARLIVAGDAEKLKKRDFDPCLYLDRAIELVLEQDARQPLSIVDFGGGGGRCGYSVLESLKPNWIVVETEAMVQASKMILSQQGLTFVTKIEEVSARCNEINILHVSSSLQYTPDPSEFLSELLTLSPEFIVFEKLVLTSAQNAVRFQQYSLLSDKIPGSPRDVEFVTRATRYPLIAMPRSEFFQSLDIAYELVELSSDPVQSHLPAFRGLEQSSMIFRRRRPL